MCNNRILTIEDLAKFCEENKFTNFSSKQSGYKLSVQVPSQLQINRDNGDDSLLFCKVKLMHSDRNRNQSSVTDEALVKASKTLAYKPILADFVEYTDQETGEVLKDFTSHAMTFNEDGTVNYIERQVGCFTADDPFFEVEEASGHNFLYGYCAIPREYTDACEIIERKNGTKISVELEVNELQYSVENHVLELTDVVIIGATCLGKNPDTLMDIEEGMKNARLDIVDFSTDNNSLFANNYYEQLVELQSRLEKVERVCFNDKDSENSKEGGIEENMFEKLLKRYGKTVDDIDFDYEGLTDDELAVKFAEMFGGNIDEAADGGVPSDETESVGFNGDGINEPEVTDAEFENIIRTYEISHEDIRWGLYKLLEPYEEADNQCYCITAVYDSWFAYQNWDATAIYGQKYDILDEVIYFDGERYTLHNVLLTDSEYADLEAMREDYSELKAFKKDVEDKELHAKRVDILESEKYSIISAKDEDGNYVNADFAALVSEMDKYSLDELETKVKVLHSDYVSAHQTFEAVPEDKPTKHDVRRYAVPKAKKKNRYGNLFDNL